MRPREDTLSSRLSVLAVLAGSTLFGTSGVAKALGPHAAPAAAVGAARVLIGGALLVALAATRRHAFRAARRRPAVTGLLGASVAVYQTCYFSGIDRVGVGIGSIMAVATVPVATGVIAWLLRGERPTRRWYPATGLGVLGMIGVSGGLGTASHPDVVGLLLCVTAGVSVGFYTVFSRALLDQGDTVTEVTTVALAISGVLLLPVLLGAGVGWLGTPSGAAMAVYLGLVTSALGFWLNARGLSWVRPTTVATLNLAEPVAAVLLAFVVLAERPSPIQIAGAGAVCVALGLLARAEQAGRTMPGAAVKPAREPQSSVRADRSGG